MAAALISLGSNLGDRAAALRQALELLALMPGVRIAATSTFHETKPAGGPASQEKFLNAAARLETELPPREIFLVLQDVEQKLGRIRAERWGPRTIDLDLLLYDELELETPELTLPHPRMSFRRFVLEPAAEIAAGMVHPVCGNTIAGLMRHLDQSPQYVAILGLTEALADALAKTRRLLVIPGLSSRLSCADQAAALLNAIEGLKQDQWLIVDEWIAPNARLSFGNDSGAERLSNPPFPLVQPKLLVFAGEVLRAIELRDQLRKSFRGPMLQLKKSSPQQLRDEVLAAIKAME